jgi:hypothetical protein
MTMKEERKMLLEKRHLEEYLADTLGHGEHSLQVCTPGPPTLVIVQDFGIDDFGDRAFEVAIIDLDSDNNMPIDCVVDYVALLRRLRLPNPKCNAKYRILPGLPLERYLALKGDIAVRGVQVPIIMDQHGNILDGWHRWSACQELGTFCPSEVRHFTTEAEKFRLIVEVNCNRRHMNRTEKRELIGTYLKVDPESSDNWLAEIIGGVSKNTIADERRRLEGTGQIAKFAKLRGKDGKKRPVNSKRIIANSPRELEKALDFIQDVPINCAGKTIDVTTARRRARRERGRRVRDAKAANTHPLPDGIRLYHRRFQELEKVAGLKPASVSAIITDIPYEKAWLEQVADLGTFAARFLVPGGLLLMMTGIQNIDDILCELKKREELKHIAKLETTWGSNTGTPCYVGKAGIIISASKPLWVYSKGPFIKKGKFITPQGPFGREKDWHPHQQPLELFRHLVRDYTEPGDLVVDPCGGGFTTALACYLENRLGISCDIDEKAVMMGTERLNKATRGEPDCP